MGLMSPRRMLQRGTKVLLTVVTWACIAGFVFQFAMEAGLFGPMRGANWGVEYAEALKLPDGRYAISLDNVARVQIYSPDWRFLYGWNTGLGGAEPLRLSADGHLSLYWARRIGWRPQVYDVNGTLLSSFRENQLVAEIPGALGQPVHVPGQSPWWWTLPFRSPFSVCATFVGDIVVATILSFLLYTREERVAYRRRMRRARGSRMPA